jgi:hypothetical protein
MLLKRRQQFISQLGLNGYKLSEVASKGGAAVLGSFRKVAKKKKGLASCPHGTTRLPLHGFS